MNPGYLRGPFVSVLVAFVVEVVKSDKFVNGRNTSSVGLRQCKTGLLEVKIQNTFIK